MVYPMKFKALYKNYIWGGRNLGKLGKDIPDGRIAESWEVSCHKNGCSIVANGDFEGTTLPELIALNRKEFLGSRLCACYDYYSRDILPLLVKFIDAEENLSVQVHPDDAYAYLNENGENGKDEMWYIISAEAGAQIICGLAPGIDRESLTSAINNNRAEECFRTAEVHPGDVIYIPAGTVHSIGRGIILAEIQQSSDITYRIYDYGRTGRELHIEKALEVINYESQPHPECNTGLCCSLGNGSWKKHYIANRHFAVELYEIKDKINEYANGDKFFIYSFFKGSGRIEWKNGAMGIQCGESVFIPAALGEYSFSGPLTGLRTYIPDIDEDILKPLHHEGYRAAQIARLITGMV